MAQPYHRFVFDLEQRRFVGQFEEMYAREDEEGFDSWQQDDMTKLTRRVALSVAAEVQAESILDVGCGKGAFCSLLKTPSNEILGVDLSPTAVEKARERYPEIEFEAMSVEELGPRLGSRSFDLVLAMEVLSYVEDWRGTLPTLASLGERILVTLYLPPDPIGFVKTFDDLREAVSQHFEIEHEVLVDGDNIVLLGRRRGD